MIYKFIDTNGSEITVNSISSLQALVDSETIKETTKVKAGLRGKWTIANKIDGLVFNKQEFIEELNKEQKEDIRTFIISDEKAELTERVQENKQEVINKENIVNNKQPWQNLKNEVESNIETQALKKDEELIDGKLEESPENSETDIDNNDENWNSETEDLNRDKTYDDINVQGINFFDSIGICFKKYFNFSGRASRSEYWYFQLFVFPIIIWSQFPSDDGFLLMLQIILLFGVIIPALSCSVRRFHDIDKNGWWVLINIIPFVGWIALIILLSQKKLVQPLITKKMLYSGMAEFKKMFFLF